MLVTLMVVAIGWYSYREVPIDAIPDVGENQVIVLTEWPGRSPKDVEDQITYPMSVALQSVSGAQSVRGKSMFGFSFVQITFNDSVDFYWARSRVAEQLSTVGNRLPEGAHPILAPDATALGQIFYYVLESTKKEDLAEIRSIQDYVVKYALQSVEGVAEVASIGGSVRQYQIDVDPDKLRFHNLTLASALQSVRDSNIEVGAKTIESAGMEFVVRGKGFIGNAKSELESIKQIEQTVIKTRNGIPITIRDVAVVQIGPDFRRGALDWNGREAVGGIVVMRYGENPREVIQRVEKKIASLEQELAGIKIHGIYDRTELIDSTVWTLTNALAQEIAITIAVIFLFLLHIRASLVVATTLPVAVLMAFIAMHTFGVDANIMSLAGIAIAIGTMVDMGIIISENIFRGVAQWENEGRPDGEIGRISAIGRMTREVAPAVITAVCTTVISFLPVFFLIGRDYRLFSPLAWTKTFSLVASLIVAVLLVPALSRIMIKNPKRGGGLATIASIVFGALVAGLGTFVWREQLFVLANSAANFVQQLFGNSPWSAGENPKPVPAFVPILVISLIGGLAVFVMLREQVRPVAQNIMAKMMDFVYEPLLRLFLRFKRTFLAIPALLVFVGMGAWLGFPTILKPLESATKFAGADLNKWQAYVDLKHFSTGLAKDDWIALDEGSWFYMPSLYPAASFSQSMEILQTQDAMIRKIPEVDHVLGKIGRADSALDPAPAGMIETYIMLKPRDRWRPGMTEQKIWNLINDVATLPGITLAAELQPIEGRVVMLQSGIKASMAVRIYGDSLEGLSNAASVVGERLKKHPNVNAGTVSPDIVLGKPYVEFEANRTELARYGMTVKAVNQAIEAALGGKNVTVAYEGRKRFPIQVRYQRGVRQNIDELQRIPIVTPTGAIVPLERLAEVQTSWGPAAILSENARLVAHVAFSPIQNADPIETVDQVMAALTFARQNGKLKLPEGNFEFEAVGSFRQQKQSFNRLFWLAPLIGIEKPKSITTIEDRFAWVAWWIPLGLLEIAILLNVFIIYLQFRRLSLTLIVFSGIPVAFAGGMILLSIAGTELNTAVFVGFVALFGIAIDDGIVMATYLDQMLKDRRQRNTSDIRDSVVTAGLKRIRPCLMTTFTTSLALMPVLFASGRCADVARAMAIPVFGGMTVALITLFIVPVLYSGVLEFKMKSGIGDPRFTMAEPGREHVTV